jgi:transposase
MAQVDVNHLIFVDETGANTAMTRVYGRAPAGERVEGSAPGQWQNVTLIAGLRPTQVVAPLVFEGATDIAAFATYVQAVLLPELPVGDVVVWDNLKVHKNHQVVEAVEGVGARVEPLPPWSSDKTPIEEMFGKVKEYLRQVAARTTEAVMTAMGEGLASVTPQDILGWFQDRCA